MSIKPLRLAAFTTEAFDEACWEHDMAFITDLSKIINVPIAELRKTLLVDGSKQSVHIATKEKEEWLHDIQCPAMIKQEDESFIRCDNYRFCFEKKCSTHKSCVSNDKLKWITDPIFNNSDYVKTIIDGETKYIHKSKITCESEHSEDNGEEEDEDNE